LIDLLAVEMLFVAGITAINHPMNNTNNQLSLDFMLVHFTYLLTYLLTFLVHCYIGH